VGELITRTIDFQESESSNRTAVAPGVSAELDDLKRTYHGLDDLLTRINITLKANLPEWARQYVTNCVFYPQLGFLTAVTINAETGASNYDGEGSDDDVWERKFMNDGQMYYKNRRMKELDGQIGDLYCMICGKCGMQFHSWP